MKWLVRWILGGRGQEAVDDVFDLYRQRAARTSRRRARLRLAEDLISLVNFGIAQRIRRAFAAVAQGGGLAGVPDDLRYAVRVLRRSPSFSASAILILALGIGATTAVFTVINAILLRPTAAEDSGAVGIYSRHATQPDQYRSFSYADYQRIRTAGGPFADVMAYNFVRPGVTVGGETRRTNAVIATANYFSLFATPLALGRQFTADEERPGSDIRVAIVAHAYWQRAGGTAAVLGTAVRLNGLDYTIVGVAPEGFSGTLSVIAPEFWVPTGVFERLAHETIGDAGARLADPQARRLMLVGRLRPGLTPAAAGPFLTSLDARLAADDPAADHVLMVQKLSRVNISSRPASDGPVAAVSGLVMGMASLVLVLACVNLANMLFARAAARRREIAVRVAVGAGRWRIVRQLLVENLVLALLGGGLGLLLASYATRLVIVSASHVLPFLLAFDGRPDWRVLMVTATLAVLSTLAAALAPAWRASRPDVLASMKGQQAGLTLGGRRFSARNVLVVTQVAVSLALLVSAGLFVRGARMAADMDPGFAATDGVLIHVDPSLAGYDEPRSRTSIGRVMEGLRGLPGVDSASLASIVPFGDERDGRGVLPAGAPTDSAPFDATYTVIGADYFETLGVRILQGREFLPAEESSSTGTAVAVIDESLARLLFGNEPPLGQTIRLAGAGERALQVVGIVAGVRNSIGDPDASPHVYVPFGQTFATGQYVHVKVQPGIDAGTFQHVVRQAITRADADLPILKLQTLQQFFRDSLPLWVLTAAARLFSTFGGVALILAVTGVYGVRAYVVSRRTHEVAVRLALGATPRDVLWLIVGEGLAVATVGLLIGVAFTWALTRVLREILVAVSPTDPLVFGGAILILASAVLLASYAPARRVTRLTGAEALRTD
jgi:predicted permease